MLESAPVQTQPAGPGASTKSVHAALATDTPAAEAAHVTAAAAHVAAAPHVTTCSASMATSRSTLSQGLSCKWNNRTHQEAEEDGAREPAEAH